MYCKYSAQNLDSTVYPEYKFETNNSIIELVYVDSFKSANCFKSGKYNTRRYLTPVNMIINLFILRKQR